jgi:hypothetical protein
MNLKKSNAGERISTAGIDKGFQTFRDNSTDNISEIAKMLREQRLRRDDAALRLPPLACGCHDPLRCRCKAGSS